MCTHAVSTTSLHIHIHASAVRVQPLTPSIPQAVNPIFGAIWMGDEAALKRSHDWHAAQKKK